jgi:hypothetical protein
MDLPVAIDSAKFAPLTKLEFLVDVSIAVDSTDFTPLLEWEFPMDLPVAIDSAEFAPLLKRELLVNDVHHKALSLSFSIIRCHCYISQTPLDIVSGWRYAAIERPIRRDASAASVSPNVSRPTFFYLIPPFGILDGLYSI